MDILSETILTYIYTEKLQLTPKHCLDPVYFPQSQMPCFALLMICWYHCTSTVTSDNLKFNFMWGADMQPYELVCKWVIMLVILTFIIKCTWFLQPVSLQKKRRKKKKRQNQQAQKVFTYRCSNWQFLIYRLNAGVQNKHCREAHLQILKEHCADYIEQNLLSLTYMVTLSMQTLWTYKIM